MLQGLRRSVASIAFKLLFALLILSFAVWGISDTYIFGQVGNTVAEVGGRQISADQLQTAYRNEMQRLRAYNIDEIQARQLGLLDQVLDNLINGALYDEAARDLGMTVTDDQLQRAIYEQFGRTIDAREFQMILLNAGLTEAQYLAQLRAQILRGQYLESLTEGSQAPRPLVEQIYRWREERRVADYVAVPVDPTMAVSDPTEEEVQAYYEANADIFTAPEYRSLRYVNLDPRTLAADITIPEDRLRRLYEEQQHEFAIPERRTVLQMLLPDEASVADAAAALKQGEGFLDVAKRLADQEESTTKLGELTRSDLPDELAEPAFALEKDSVSQPIKGPFGFHLLLVTDIEPGRTSSFEEVKDELAHNLVHEEALEQVFSLANKLENELGTGATLIEAAQTLGLPLHELPAVDRDGRDPDGKPIPDLPGPPFLTTIFETPAGEESLLRETGDNEFFAVHVDSVTPPALRPLADVRGEAVEGWKQEQRWAATRQRADEIVEKASQGTPLTDVAEAFGHQVHRSEPFTRDRRRGAVGLPSALVSQLFGMPAVGEVTKGDGSDAVFVVQLAEIIPADPGADAQGMASLKDNLRLGIAEDIALQLNAALRKKHQVTIDHRTLQYYFPINAGDS